MDQDWLNDLDHSTCVLVPTRSLQSELHAEIARHHISAGQTVWESAHILTWPDFLDLHWRRNRTRLKPNTAVLKPHQAQLLWESVIEQSRRQDEALTLLNVQQTARAVRRSWQLSHDWQIDLTVLRDSGLEDTQQFLTWSQQYNALLKTKGLLDSVSLYQALTELKDSGQLQTPFRGVIWYGFDLITSAQQQWRSRFEESECRHLSRALAAKPTTRAHYAYPDSRSELRAALLAARERVENDPAHRVAIVVPTLAQQRETLESLAAEIFYDGQSPGALQNNNLVYRFSLGHPLARWPAIEAALQCLRLLSGQASINDFCWLIRNPFIAAIDGQANDARGLIRWLKSSGNHRLTLADIRPLLLEVGLVEDGDLSQQLLAIAAFLEKLADQLDEQQRQNARRTLPLSEWRSVFVGWLEIWGWHCGEADQALSSVQYQLLEKWRQLIKEFEGLTVVRPRLGLTKALERITALSRETIFLPKAAAAPVFIAGLFEAIGTQSDTCFITGLNDSFPTSTRPDPFIGEQLRQHESYPGATPLRQMQQARQVIESVMSSASHCVLSYALNNEQNPDVSCGVSPLFRDQSFAPQSCPPTSHPLIELETFDDPSGLPLSNPGGVKGGIGILTDQSNCAFRAYARHRLRCESEQDAEFGIDPLERGELVHTLLELAWGRLQTSLALSELIDHDQLESFTKAVAKDTITRFEGKLNDEKSGLIKLEENRLSALLQEWLLLETGRPTSFGVAAIEETGQHTIGNLTFQYKVDRVDLLDDGRTVVIDYKTGLSAKGDLFGERLRQPQLAIYVNALTEQKNTAPSGAALAQIRPFECQFAELAEIGIFKPENHHSRRTMDQWSEASKAWPDQLTQLAHDFENGDARVNPIDEKTCAYCDLQSLCRINQARNALDVEMDHDG